MSTNGLKLAEKTPCDYHFPVVRCFNQNLLRVHAAMRMTQTKRLRLILPLQLFPLLQFDDFEIHLEHSQDNARARVVCQDRWLFVQPLRPHIIGVCPKLFGGPYLSRALIYAFVGGI